MSFALRQLRKVPAPTSGVRGSQRLAIHVASKSAAALRSPLTSQLSMASARWTFAEAPRRLFASAPEHVEKVPPLGDSISEGTLVEWHKEVGDAVKQDEVICVLETDKVSVDIRATKSGKILSHAVKTGDTVLVGGDLCRIAPGEAGAASAPAPQAAAAPAPAAAAKPAAAPAAAAPAPAAAPKAEAPKLAAAPAKAAAAPAPALPKGVRTERRVQASRMRQTIASRLKEAQNTAALLTTFNEIDMTNIMDLRNKYKDEFFEQHKVKLGFMSAFVASSAAALRKFPEVNAYLDGKDIVYRDYVDISVAVATPTGLVVPVIRNVETLSFADIELTIGALGEKARKNQIALEDMVGGTFTISNGGVFGSLMGTPIVNLPQSAILGMHGTFKRPVVINDKIEIRPMMYIALTYDHRMIDGATAVRFLKQVKRGVEDPATLLLNV